MNVMNLFGTSSYERNDCSSRSPGDMNLLLTITKLPCQQSFGFTLNIIVSRRHKDA